MLIGWLFWRVLDGLEALAKKLRKSSEGRPVLGPVARSFELFVSAFATLAAVAAVLTLLVGFVWLILWRKLLYRVPWGAATWWMWLAGGLPLLLFVVVRPLIGGSRLIVSYDEPPEITGLAAWRNRRLSREIWRQLDRVAVTKRRSPDAYVTVDYEFALAAISVPFWSSSTRVGIHEMGGLVLAMNGAGSDEGKEWRGRAAVALRRLDALPYRAGSAQFWQAFPERAPGTAAASAGA